MHCPNCLKQMQLLYEEIPLKSFFCTLCYKTVTKEKKENDNQELNQANRRDLRQL